MWCSGLYSRAALLRRNNSFQVAENSREEPCMFPRSFSGSCGFGVETWSDSRLDPEALTQEAPHLLAEAMDPGSGPDHRHVESFTTHSKSYRSRQEAHADTGQYLTLRRGLETEPPAPNTSPTEGNDTSTLLWLSFSPLNNANATTERKKGGGILKRKKF